MATAKKTTAVKEIEYPSRNDEILGLLSELEGVVKINSISLGNEARLNTGLLCLDMMIGGGLAPGMYVFVGPEQSAKTTAAITITGASVKQNVDLRVLWDAENSSGSSTDYLTNIFNQLGLETTVDQIFGVKVDGKYKVPPQIYYQDGYSGEQFFNWVHGLQKRLPDKRFQDGKWWYVYEETQKMKQKLGDSIDRKMTSRGDGLWVPAEDGSLQAIIVLDSLPALIPESQDDDEGDNSLAVNARMFAKQIPRIKGSMRAKRIAFVAINQLRLAPMVRFGNPETEPGGQAIKYFSDCRLRFYPRALSGVPFHPKGEGQIEKEPSVNGEGEDTYRYIAVSTIKNKLSVPGRMTWLRLWVSDHLGEAQGYDLAWDSFFFLHQTGQIIAEKRSKIVLNIQGLGQASKAITWLEFKTLIVGKDKAAKKAIFDKIGYKVVDLRKGLTNQVRKGKAEDLFMEASKASAAKKKVIDQEESSDD